MTFQFKQRNPEIILNAIELFEKAEAIKLPADYAQFLREYNGGVLDTPLIEYEEPYSGATFAPLEELYGLGKQDTKPLITNELQHMRNKLREHLPSDKLAIGSVSGGHMYIIISLEIRTFGQISLWLDHGTFECRLANNFSKFLELLIFSDP